MKAYLKASNRPYCLDRCLRSIRRHVSGLDGLVVLDDGTRERYLEKLAAQHPDVEFRSSPKGKDKYAFMDEPGFLAGPPGQVDLLRTFSPAMDPARFWVKEVARDPGKYLFIQEEDTWFVSPVDLNRIRANMDANQAILTKLFWNETDPLPGPDEVFLSAVFGDGFILDYFRPRIEGLLHVHKIFNVAQSVLLKEYWLNSYDGVPHWAHEEHLLARAVDFVNAHPHSKFCKARDKAIVHTALSTSRSDCGGMGVASKIDVHRVNFILNEAWLHGELDPMQGFPRDMDEEYVAAILEQAMGRAEINSWRQWKTDYSGMYEGTPG